MERKVTCPKCEAVMIMEIWSDTLSQVVKCTSCSNRFTFDPKKDTERERKGLPMDESPDKGVTEPQKTKKVVCPSCSWEFKAGLPDNEKPILTTQCPKCEIIFQFPRRDAPEKEMEKEQVGEKTELKMEIEKEEDFAIPVALKEQVEKETQEEEKRPEEEGEGKPAEEDISQWQREREDIYLIKDRGIAQGRKRAGAMITITCPFCEESFDAPATRSKNKVECPICEQDFMVNALGEYIPRKAIRGVAGGLAKIFGIELIRSGQETIRESMDGLRLLKEPKKLKPRFHNLSGKAGILLVMVSILGLLYAGALALTIPGSGEGDAVGRCSVTGDVLYQMDTLEDANVNITDLEMYNQTNSQGFFFFEMVPAGDHTLEVSSAGKGKLVVKFTIGKKEIKQGTKDLGGLELPDNGTVEKDLSEDRVERARFVTSILVIFVILVSMVTFMAGLLAIQAKRFTPTLFLAGLAIFTVGFLFGMILAIIAVILIILGRKEFTS